MPVPVIRLGFKYILLSASVSTEVCIYTLFLFWHFEDVVASTASLREDVNVIFLVGGTKK